jgi:hypothetical protein
MILPRKRNRLAVLATASVLLGSATTHAQQQLPCDTPARGYAITPLVDVAQTLFVPHDFRLFLPHNFHTASPPSPAGIAALSDLAYVSTQTDLEGHDRQVLNILLASGDGCFAAPSQPDRHPPSLVVGDKPSLIASDTLMGDAHADIAIIDTQVDQFNRSAKLRIFAGDGAGHFNPAPGISVFPLAEGQTPVAIATGRFRGVAMPVDIALATLPNSSPTAGGQVILLLNDGHGEFTASSPPISLGDLRPAAIVASDGFRAGAGSQKRVDLVVKESVSTSSERNRILYLLNAGSGTFPDIKEITASGRSGNTDALLTGVLQNNSTSGNRLDIITFDEDMTPQIFVNDGLGGFNRRNLPTFAGNLKFAFDGATLSVVDLGDNTLHLLGAVITKEGKQGMFLATADGSGGFLSPPSFRQFRDLPTPPGGETTSFSTSASTQPPTKSLIIASSVAAQFLNASQGEKPGLALSGHHLVTEVADKPCPPDTSRQPASARVSTAQPLAGPSMGHRCLNRPPLVCQDPGNIDTVCQDPPPAFGDCFCRCVDDPGDGGDTGPPPPPTACSKSTVFPATLIVIANPFTSP